jgi:hypothetical protein
MALLILFNGIRVYYPFAFMGADMLFSFRNLAPAKIRRWRCSFINGYLYEERKLLYEKRNYCQCNSE